MVYKWSILRHMPNMCSIDIFKGIRTSPVAPIPAYRMRTMSVAYSMILVESLKTCVNPPRGRGGKRIETLASEDVVTHIPVHFVFVQKFSEIRCHIDYYVVLKYKLKKTILIVGELRKQFVWEKFLCQSVGDKTCTNDYHPNEDNSMFHICMILYLSPPKESDLTKISISLVHIHKYLHSQCFLLR